MDSRYSFPQYPFEALAMLYLEKLDTSDLSPVEFVDKYNEVLVSIKKRYNDTYTKRKPDSSK